jgi:hypothetical protein
MKTIIGLLTILFSVQTFANNDVTLKCSVREGVKNIVEKEIVNAYGGGQVFTAKTSKNGTLSVTVMIAENEDNKDLTDLQLLISKSTDKSLLILNSNGLSKNKYNDNGLVATIVSDKNGKIIDSVSVSCKL